MIGIKHGPKDWLISKGNTENAIDALLSRVKVNYSYDVPDLAGYSEDGKSFFIDKNCPKVMQLNSKEVDVKRYLVVHEEVECGLIKLLHLTYQDCHQIACLAEKEAVEVVEGMGAWQAYSDFMRKQIDMAWNKKAPKVPPNLYKKPYVDEKEFTKLKAMGYAK